ncbi:MAG: hypothetical protein WCC57_09090 [Paracoccaceae bacterium]
MQRMVWVLLLLALCPAPVRAEQTLSVAVTMAQDRDFIQAMLAAQKIGAQATTLSLFWDETMVDGHYAPARDWSTVANSFYPTIRVKLSLVLSVIDTVVDRRPAELRGLAWDDPALLTAFEAYATAVISRMDRVDLVSISIGNEVDGYLASGAEWAAYQQFFIRAKAVVKRLRPSVPVGVNLTWPELNGASGEQAQALAAQGDVWLINHYSLDGGFAIRPPSEITATLDAMLKMAGDAPVYLAEVGYPSGGCGSDEAGQLAFYQTLFAAWDARAARIPLITLVWLHDLPDSEVQNLAEYYGVGGDCFARYLGTLGLRTYEGEDKPAYAWLRSR